MDILPGIISGEDLRVLKWIGFGSSISTSYLIFRGSPIPTSLRGYAAFGAVMGAAWWFIKDYLCVPHGSDTLKGQLMAYGLMGGVLMATIVHPVNFVYGVAAGVAFGSFKTHLDSKALPRGMEWKIKGTDEEKRRILLREDEEFELSQRNVLTVRHNLYPL